MRLVVTGCLGFIGSQFTKTAIRNNYNVTGVNRVTSSRNLTRIKEIYHHANLNLVYKDLSHDDLSEILDDAEVVVNFAAKTFVDHSIRAPEPFIQSNIVGTFRLLEEVRKSKTEITYVQVSTDEVYGAILNGAYKEDSRLNPTNPYSASKAAADMLVTSYNNTYGLKTIITRTENNYGPFQGKEKAIPTFIRKALNHEPLPVYGDGKHKRMWLHVEDHVSGIMTLISKGKFGDIYHIAGDEELENLELAKRILNILGTPITDGGKVEFLPDENARPGHDRRYALNTNKIRELGWKPKYNLETGLSNAVNWYVENSWWFN
jgi:dTDP-glucose 4,6-dehydratase